MFNIFLYKTWDWEAEGPIYQVAKAAENLVELTGIDAGEARKKANAAANMDAAGFKGPFETTIDGMLCSFEVKGE